MAITFIKNIHLNIPLPELLGYEIYHSENVEGMENFSGYENFEGFGELGEPITLASIGAAIGVGIITFSVQEHRCRTYGDSISCRDS